MNKLSSSAALTIGVAALCNSARRDDAAVRATLARVTRYADLRQVVDALLVTVPAIIGDDQRDKLAHACEVVLAQLAEDAERGIA